MLDKTFKKRLRVSFEKGQPPLRKLGVRKKSVTDILRLKRSGFTERLVPFAYENGRALGLTRLER